MYLMQVSKDKNEWSSLHAWVAHVPEGGRDVSRDAEQREQGQDRSTEASDGCDRRWTSQEVTGERTLTSRPNRQLDIFKLAIRQK